MSKANWLLYSTISGIQQQDMPFTQSKQTRKKAQKDFFSSNTDYYNED